MQNPEEPLVSQPVSSVPPVAPKPSVIKRAAVIIGGTALCFGLINLFIWTAYMGRAYPGVKIGAQQVANQDQMGIAASLADYTKEYSLQVDVRGERHILTADQLGLNYDLAGTAQAAINQGKNQWLPLYGLIYTWQNGALPLRYSVDQVKLDKLVSSLAGTDTVVPVNAKVVVDGSNISVQDDQPGQGVDAAKLRQLINDRLAEGGRKAQIGEQSVTAPVTAQKAATAAQEARKAVQTVITLEVSGKRFTPSPSDLGKWLSFTPDKSGNLVLGANLEAIKSYLAGVASQVDVAAVNKQINMVNGVVKTVSDGKNGLALDRDAAAKAFGEALLSSKSTTVPGVMNAVAFKTRTNNSVDLNGKYIEINLSRQHMWAYDEKQLVYDSAITSGATGAGLPTVQGLFSIKAKQTNRNLNGFGIGYNYNVFVQYWMPFYGNYGLHDASWRTSFGGPDYYYGGSHGCVNLPLATAAWLYNWAIVGTPVWVHS